MTFALLPHSTFNPTVFDAASGQFSGEQSRKPEQYGTSIFRPFDRPERKRQRTDRGNGKEAYLGNLASQSQDPDAGLWVTQTRTAIPISDHLTQGRSALESLASSEQRTRCMRRHVEEMRWLAGNRHRYAGCWIALDGDQLLAVGATSKEVFLAVGGQTPPPLVIRVEALELPFAGW